MKGMKGMKGKGTGANQSKVPGKVQTGIVRTSPNTHKSTKGGGGRKMKGY